ncbi:HPr family phosphocarrier protein [Thalassoglobus sp. JC818]|uniref:HPr family phosphocarrier protein n=1 Tax=Thalassoglobus sp. JC818 TaxID=3232136 RepID=UPI00345AEE9B
MNGSIVLRRTVRLKITQGLHIRACSNVIALVGRHSGQVRITYGDKTADASSMFDLVQLAAVPDSMLELEATGDEAEQVLNELEELLSRPEEPS